MAIKKKSIPLILLGLVFIMPLVVAYILFINHAPPTHKTVNHGQLLMPPVDVSSIPVTDGITHNDERFTSLQNQWLLAYYLPNVCQKDCIENIYYITQIKKALGKKQHFVNPLFITNQELPKSDQEQLIANYPTIHYFLLDQQANQQWQTLLQNEQPAIYIIDPQSHAMMVYASGHNAKEILKDLQRLLSSAH